MFNSGKTKSLKPFALSMLAGGVLLSPKSFSHAEEKCGLNRSAAKAVISIINAPFIDGTEQAVFSHQRDITTSSIGLQ
ncbi:uncharacterized protein EpC_25330 [Erwinia pyrifoliae Ep1/96]|nr:hypothetical protein CPI84_05760 [Erwinia pyrifoliae]MCA8877732.1 hypothetical protein [Erwinia pyrifoliae]CAX56312.1 uncharacterized protein EpC_25330 [Erwinia pyrifoliae Ep1/96]